MCPITNEPKSHCYSGHQGTKRLGVMHVSYPLILRMLPPGKVIDCVADKIGTDADWLAEVFHLPANAKITGVSMNYRFMNNQVSLRIECPDFVEIREMCAIPEVEAWYGQDWTGPAVTPYYNIKLARVKKGLPVDPKEVEAMGGQTAEDLRFWNDPQVSAVSQTEPRAPIMCNVCNERQVVPDGDGKCGPCWAKGQL